jgi:hypothetical protein
MRKMFVMILVGMASRDSLIGSGWGDQGADGARAR